MYRAFLMYTQFYAAPTPVVICEGATDNVYLTHAIRSLAAEYPALAEVRPGNKILLKVRLYKYPRSSTARVLDLRDGGSSVLAKFIPAFKKETGHFAGPGLEHPVIILYDNDKGANNIRSAVAQASKKRPDGAEQFVHVVKNLYAMPTPLLEGAAESKIEDFFDAKTKATVVGNKTFCDSNKFDSEKHYGKKVFAHRVVSQNADTIDFGGFRPLLTNLTAAIAAHSAPRGSSSPSEGNHLSVKKESAERKAASNRKVAKKKAAPKKSATEKKTARKEKTTRKRAAPKKKATRKKAAPKKKATRKKAAPKGSATRKRAVATKGTMKKATEKKAAMRTAPKKGPGRTQKSPKKK